MANNAAKSALAEIKKLEATKKTILAKMPKSNTGPQSEKLLAELEAEIKQIDAKIAELRKVSEESVGPSDLVQQKSGEKGGRTKVGNTAGDVTAYLVESCLRAFAVGYVVLHDTGRKTMPLPSFPGANLTYFSEIIGEFSGQRAGAGLAARVNIIAKAQIGLGFGFDLSVPHVGGLRFMAGAELGPEAKVEQSFSLSVVSGGLEGTLSASVIDLAVSAQLFLDTPFRDTTFRAIVALIPNSSVRGGSTSSTMNIALGRLSIFEIRTAASTIRYSSNQGFSYAIKPPNIGLTAEFRQKINSVRNIVSNAMSELGRRLNPMNWDLNPFD